MARKYYRKSLLHRILLSYDNGKKYEIDLLGAVNLMAEAWRQLRPLVIANCFAHAGFSRAPESMEEDIGAEFSGCDELCNEVRKATGCVSDTEDGEIAFEDSDIRKFSGQCPVREARRRALGIDRPRRYRPRVAADAEMIDPLKSVSSRSAGTASGPSGLRDKDYKELANIGLRVRLIPPRKLLARLFVQLFGRDLGRRPLVHSRWLQPRCHCVLRGSRV
ncbi:hypothetical protein MRX96_046006 [Rhipicephalus microplus]